MRKSRPFGVVLIRDGMEVGAQGTALTSAVGTTARIVDFTSLADGLLGITCIGERKFTVARRWQQPDGLHRGDLEYAPEETAVTLPPEFGHLGALLRKALPQLGDFYANMPKHFSDASWVGCRLAEILPIGLSEKQHCLELDDPLGRLSHLNALIRTEAA
jgi:Lon protease-like protein